VRGPIGFATQFEIPSDMAFRSLRVLARFEFCQPGVGFFLRQVQAGGLIVVPSRERGLKELLAS